MRLTVEQERKEAAMIGFTALQTRLQDVRDLTSGHGSSSGANFGGPEKFPGLSKG